MTTDAQVRTTPGAAGPGPSAPNRTVATQRRGIVGRRRPVWDFPVQVGRVQLRNPVIAASGTYGYGLEYCLYGKPASLGAVIVKSLTVEPRPGFPAPRVTLLPEPGAMLNAIGVRNPGVVQWAETTLPKMRAAGAPVVASIWGMSADEVVAAAELLARYSGPIAWEVNLSCPNSEHQRAPVSHDAESAAEVCRTVRMLAPEHVGIWAKLSPDAPDVQGVALACHKAGADAVTVGNTYPAAGSSISGASTLGGGAGGISGSILRHHVRPLIEKLGSSHPELPVLACGGVTNSDIALDYLQLGARAVQVGTASLFNPRACHKIARGVVAKLQRSES